MIDGIIEKPQGELPSALVSLGRFVLAPSIFEAIDLTPYTSGEAYLTDSISILAKQKRCAHTSSRRADTISAIRKAISKPPSNMRSETKISKANFWSISKEICKTND